MLMMFFSTKCFWLLGIQCGFPANITNGSYKLINDTVNYLSQVLYSCTHGYQMNGRDRLICDLDERWDGPPPKCSGNTKCFYYIRLHHAPSKGSIVFITRCCS